MFHRTVTRSSLLCCVLFMQGLVGEGHRAGDNVLRTEISKVVQSRLEVVSQLSSTALQVSVAAPLSRPATIPANLIGWFQVPNSNLRRVCPPNTSQYEFSGACGTVVSAWNSAIADTKRNRLILWGGGHADYFGNELYTFSLQDLTMTRLNDPSPINTTPACVETLSDGKPNSRHTYDSLVYIAHADRMFSFGGSLNTCGFFGDVTWTLDVGTLQWTKMQPRGGNPRANPGVVADYDPITKKVYLDDLSKFWNYDFDTNTYRVLNTDAVIDYHMTGVVDPKLKMFFIMGAAGSAGGGLKAISLAPGSNFALSDWTGPASSTCGPLLSAISPGLAYDPFEDRIVGWPDFGDEVYLFDPGTKTCAKRVFPGGPPDSSHQGSPHTTNGTNGRFRFFPDEGVFVLVNEAGNNVYLLRLTPPMPSRTKQAP
jgi:hypothetical protein